MRQGAQYATALMVRGFFAKGYEVDLLLSEFHFESSRQGKVPFEVPAGVNIVRLPHVKARGNIGALRRYLRRTNAVAVVAMSQNYTWCLRLASIGLLHCPKLVHVEHGLAGLDDGVARGSVGTFTKRGMATRFLYHGYDRVLTVSAKGKDEFIRYYSFYPHDSVHIVYNPVVDEVFYAKRKCQAVHPWLLNKECPTFVSAGAYQEYKGHHDLIEAMRLLQGRLACRVVVFGSGPLNDAYNKLIEDHQLQECINFAGYTDNLPAELSHADGFVLSSIEESFGIVLVEALACGCPVLSTDAPFGPREILNNGEYGMLVPVHDPAALAAGLEKLARGEIAKAPDASWQRFTLEAAVERYEQGIGLK